MAVATAGGTKTRLIHRSRQMAKVPGGSSAGQMTSGAGLIAVLACAVMVKSVLLLWEDPGLWQYVGTWVLQVAAAMAEKLCFTLGTCYARPWGEAAPGSLLSVGIPLT